MRVENAGCEIRSRFDSCVHTLYIWQRIIFKFNGFLIVACQCNYCDVLLEFKLWLKVIALKKKLITIQQMADDNTGMKFTRDNLLEHEKFFSFTQFHIYLGSSSFIVEAEKELWRDDQYLRPCHKARMIHVLLRFLFITTNQWQCTFQLRKKNAGKLRKIYSIT